jgi:hypothetical protein
MPRESVHFHVANQVRKSLQLTSIDEELFLIGSVAHDSFYYFGGGGTEFENIALYLHGTNGEDTLRPISELWSSLDGETKGPVGSFLLGMLTHVATDSVFHPMVYFLTGNYFDPDFKRQLEVRSRHRLFEAKLDGWIEQRTGALKTTLGKLLKLKRNELDQVTKYLSELGPLDLKATPKDWMNAISTHALIDSVSRSKLLTPVIHIGALVSSKLRVLKDCIVSNEQLVLPNSFNNPVTNQREELNLDSLLLESIELSMKFISQLMNAGHLEDGPSLNFGVAGKSVEEGRYFLSSANV